MKKMKKALYVATVVKTHIMEFHIPYLKMLKEMGFETAVAARNDYENPEDCAIPYCDHYYDIHFERSPFSFANIKAYKELKRIIDEGHYDIIHCHTPVAAILTRIAAKKARKNGSKVFYTAHGFHFYIGAPVQNWLLYYPAEWLCSWWTDVLITINKEDYKRASEHFHAKKTVYIPGVGVDTAKFAVCKVDKHLKRQELGFKDTDFVLLSVGELSERKNQKIIIDALGKMKVEGTIRNIVYLAAGDGDKREEFEALIHYYKLENHARLIGYRTDIDELCEIADCFVHPSVREGLGIAPLEAMASGLPIISAHINGMKDYLEDGVSGCTIDPTDVDQMISSIEKMYNDEVFRNACGANNLETVKTFDLTKSLGVINSVYDEIATPPPEAHKLSPFESNHDSPKDEK